MMKQIQNVITIFTLSTAFLLASCRLVPPPPAIYLPTPTATQSNLVEHPLDFKLDETELELPRALPGYGAVIMDVSVSPDDSVIAGGICYSVLSNTGVEKCDFGNLNLWDSTTGKRIAEAEAAPSSPIGAVSYSPDGQWIASTLLREPGSAEVVFWEARNLTELFSLPIPEFDQIYGNLAFSKDGKLLAWSSNASSTVGRVVIWNIETRQPVFQLVTTDFSIVDSAFHDPIFAGLLCRPAGENCKVTIWNIENSREIFSMSLGNEILPIPSLAFNHAGSLVALTLNDSEIIILETTSFQQKNILKTSGCSDFSFSADDKFLFAVNLSPNQPLSIFNLATHETTTSRGENPGIYLSMFHHSDRFVAPNQHGNESIFRFSPP